MMGALTRQDLKTHWRFSVPQLAYITRVDVQSASLHTHTQKLLICVCVCVSIRTDHSVCVCDEAGVQFSRI